MRVAICDDSRSMLEDIDKLVEEYMNKNESIHSEVKLFRSAKEILAENQFFDIYILDIIMPDMTGIDLGRVLKIKNPYCFLIYLTSSKEYALDAFELHAQRYLLKPVNMEELFEALETAKKMINEPKQTYSVKTPKGIISVRINEIEYVESAARKMKIHLSDGTELESLYMRSSFEAEVSELVGKSEFVFVGKSYLVNMNFISKMDGDKLEFEMHPPIYMNKKIGPEIKKSYLNYLSGAK